MLAHHLAVALAKFRMTPLITAANVLALALGLACFIAAWGIASWWRSGDQHHPGADRIVFVASTVPSGPEYGAAPPPVASAPPLAPALRAEFPELESVARLWDVGELGVSSGDVKGFLAGAYADAKALDLFAFTFLEGDPASALRGPDDLILTRDAARRFFGDAPALGRRLIINNDWEGVVAGVIAPMPQPSFMGEGADALFRFEILGTMSRSIDSMRFPGAADSWWLTGPITVARLPETLPMATFADRLADFSARAIPPSPDGDRITLAPAPLSELTTRLVDRRFLAVSAIGVSMDVLLPGLGAFILLIACVNYANLAAAQTLAAAKTIGMRKVLGAGRGHVMAQYWLEAGLQTLAALLLAVAAVALAAPVIRAFVGADALHFLAAGPQGAAVVALVALAVSAAAAAYPAQTTAQVRTSDALSGGRARGGPRVASRILVGVQFLSASFLLIIVTVMQSQEGELRRLALEGREDPVVLLGELNAAGVDFETLSGRLATYPQIHSVTALNWAPWERSGLLGAFGRSPEPAATGELSWSKTVGLDYFETFEQDLLAGRVFDPARDAPGDMFVNDAPAPISAVIDERLARLLGFSSPRAAVGELVYEVSPRLGEHGARPPPSARVIGVVATEVSRLQSGPSGVLYQLGASEAQGYWLPAVRIARDDVPGALAAITQVWDDLAPDAPLRFNFYDELFERSLASFNRVKAAFVGLSLSAFVISTFGLLGIAVHVAARRRHEIGVRKTLGASRLGIVRLLLVDFSKPVLVANLLAWPLGYLAAQAYLAQFAERVALTPAPFALSMGLTLVIAWTAVMGEVLKAASVRPAEVLRHA